MTAEISRRWKREEVLGLATRIRLEMANRDLKSKVLVAVGELSTRLPVFSSCASNLSRWLRHTDEGNNWKLLFDDELDRINTWLSEGSTVDAKLLAQMLPSSPSWHMQNWTESNGRRLQMEECYRVYRGSAIVTEYIVVGTLTVEINDVGISTKEEYVVTGAGRKSGRYRSTGFILTSSDGPIYHLSKFENGDLQFAIFSELQRSGLEDNRVISMAGLVTNTIFNRPYAARIYCEEMSSASPIIGMVKPGDLPAHIKDALLGQIKVSPSQVVVF